MRIGLQLLCGLVLIFALAAWFVLEIFVEEIKPGVRSATEDTLVDMAQMLAPLALDDLQEGRMADGRLASAFARLNQSPINALIDGHLKQQAEYRIYVVDRWGKVVYDSDGVDLGKDYSRWNDVYLTLRGEYGARSTRSDPDDPTSSVMHVAAPLREGDDILGSLTVAKPNRTLLPMIEPAAAGGSLAAVHLTAHRCPAGVVAQPRHRQAGALCRCGQPGPARHSATPLQPGAGSARPLP